MVLGLVSLFFGVVGCLFLYLLFCPRPLATIDDKGIAVLGMWGQPLVVAWEDVCDVSFRKVKNGVRISVIDPGRQEVTVPTGTMSQEELGEEIVARWIRAVEQMAGDFAPPLPMARPLRSEAMDRPLQRAGTGGPVSSSRLPQFGPALRAKGTSV